MLSVDKVERKPGENEIEGVGIAELSKAGPPERSLAKDFAIGSRLMVFCGFRLKRGITPGEPGYEPQERERAENEEHCAPAVRNKNRCSEERADGGAHRVSDAHRAVAATALVLERVLRENPRIGRENHALRQAKQHAEDEQHDETG